VFSWDTSRMVNDPMSSTSFTIFSETCGWAPSIGAWLNVAVVARDRRANIRPIRSMFEINLYWFF